MTTASFSLLQSFIEGNLGIKVPPSKQVMLDARLAKRLRALKMDSYEQYCNYVFSPAGFEQEVQQLIDVVTTNETDFFREEQHYDYLVQSVLPNLLSSGDIKQLNVWSVASSTGQEAYTLAMVIDRYLKQNNIRMPYSILATDISGSVLRIGEIGVYTEHQARKIPADLKRAYCMKSKQSINQTIRFKSEIRDKILFRQLNLMAPIYPIKKKYHIVFCRNVFIYFDRETQKKILDQLFGHMSSDSYLFMGHCENIVFNDVQFTSVAPSVYVPKIGAKHDSGYVN